MQRSRNVTQYNLPFKLLDAKNIRNNNKAKITELKELCVM